MAGYAGVGGLMNSMVTRAIIVISILSLVGLAFTYPTNTVRADTGKIYLISAEGFCEDGIDNDGDGDTDYQDAINCRLVPPNWAQPPVPEICGDGIDNDQDGYADRWDMGDCMDCYHAQACPGGPVNPGDPSPFGPLPTHGLLLFESCWNGVDDDRDGIIDQVCPRGIPNRYEYCSNNFDDNYDGRIDETVDERGIACIPF